ncbi:hypothetical protein CLU79DRAFT_696040 [Phycomyces nitens]|nr:hypothetical protein CLU79DRAFT_696040 [Phycomyces nitens]
MSFQVDSFRDVPLTSLSLTLVEFSSDDKIGYAFAYITLLPLAILIFYASVIVSRRELAGIFMLAGQLLNEGLNAILKEYLKMHRPYGHLGTGYGMPSSHAQFMWIYLGYHTSAQVAVGAFIGSIFGVLWYSLIEYVVRPSGLVDFVLRQRFAKLIYLRDMRYMDNTAKWDYQQWENFVESSRPKQA